MYVILKNIVLFLKRKCKKIQREKNEWRVCNKMVDINLVLSIYTLKGRECQVGYKIRFKCMSFIRDVF